jgi:hypothetical protein
MVLTTGLKLFRRDREELHTLRKRR